MRRSSGVSCHSSGRQLHLFTSNPSPAFSLFYVSSLLLYFSHLPRSLPLLCALNREKDRGRGGQTEPHWFMTSLWLFIWWNERHITSFTTLNFSHPPFPKWSVQSCVSERKPEWGSNEYIRPTISVYFWSRLVVDLLSNSIQQSVHLKRGGMNV